MKLFISFALCLSFSLSLLAQQAKESTYTIQLGAFKKPKISDFNKLNSYGYVFTEKMTSDLYLVYLSAFKSRDDAQLVLTKIHNTSFEDAFIVERKMELGKHVSVMQLAAYKETDDIDWNKYKGIAKLYSFISDGKIKLCTSAKSNEILSLKSNYKGSFVRTVNTMLLHQINEFDQGKYWVSHAVDSYEHALVAKGANITNRKMPQPKITKVSVTKKGAITTHTKVKRNSAFELQKILKLQKYYNGSLDGYYGQKTAVAIEKFKADNWQYKKYKLLGALIESPVNVVLNDLQETIDNMPVDPVAAANQLAQFDYPIAKAYEALALYKHFGPNQNVDDLMNEAIQKIYQRTLENQPPFDFYKSYKYTELQQLISHLRYLHTITDDIAAVPCWLLELHREEAIHAFEPADNLNKNNYPLKACTSFLDWEEINTLQAIAIDLNANQNPSLEELVDQKNRRAKLSFALRPLSDKEQYDLIAWHKKTMTNFANWIQKDAVHNKWEDCFKVAYYQSIAKLEDYFLDKNYTPLQARTNAIAVVKTILEPYL